MTAITTYTNFVDALRDMTVTDVKRRYEEPPTLLNTADLPASWPELPSGMEPMLTAGSGGGWPSLRCNLVIATEPVGQNTQPENFKDMLTMMDNLSTALRGAVGTIGRGAVTWEIRGNSTITVGSVAYWGVVVTVTAE